MVQGFKYKASAQGVSGAITRPFQQVIPTQVSVALPERGGYSTDRAGAFNFQSILSFASAEAVVSGSIGRDETSFDTIATVTIEGLNVLGMVTADRIVARIASSHRNREQSSFLALGSYFENLRIGGHPVNIVLDFGAFQAPVQGEMQGVSLVHKVEQLPKGCDCPGPHVIRVPEFGTIRLAQFRATVDERELTMVEIEMGSTPTGNVKVGGPVAGNGSDP